MGRKVFLLDIDACNGCHNCQLACKDEHCEVDWLPYTKAQPLTGQFWWKVEQKTRGSVPKVMVTYVPQGCNHCTNCAADAACKCGAFQRREDGFILIDPEKCDGCGTCVSACPYNAVWFNEELKIAQKCTGCAHLLDDGWDKPRCVDACVVEALKYVDIDDPAYAEAFAKAEVIAPENGTDPQVYYLNYPKRWVAGEIYDEDEDEVIIGAKVTLACGDEGIAATETDEFGDFWFKQVEAKNYTLYVEKEGYLTRVIPADATQIDAHVGAIALYKQA